MKKRGAGTNRTSASVDVQVRSPKTPDNRTRHLIALKAYELYEQRGRIDGHALEDWLKAEAIVNGTTE